MSDDADKPVSQDTDKDAMMAELKAQVLALEKWKREYEERQAQDVFKAARSAPTGAPLESPLGPTAKLAIDRAERPPDRDQLDLINAVGIVRPGGK
jgi:hypothetical protein